MKNRNTLLGLVVAMLLAAGIVWWVKQAPTEKPVAASAPAKPAAQVAVPTAPLKAAVAAPTAPVVVPTANPKPAEAPVAAANPEADLNTVVSNLITTLQSGDVDAFVQNYIAPSMKGMLEARMSQMPNATPEMKAQMEQMIEQQQPTMIQQLTQQLSQRPDTTQRFQQLAVALQSAQATPQMNEAGDRATYNLQANGDKNVPTNVVLFHHDGIWSIDIASMMQGGASL